MDASYRCVVGLGVLLQLDFYLSVNFILIFHFIFLDSCAGGVALHPNHGKTALALMMTTIKTKNARQSQNIAENRDKRKFAWTYLFKQTLLD